MTDSHSPVSTRPDLPTTPLEAVKALVALDTTSATGNIAAVELVRDMLQASGICTHLLREDSGKDANLIAVFPAAGDPVPESSDRMARDLLGDAYAVGHGGVDRLDGEAQHGGAPTPRRGILIAGHADCVPVTDQQWVSEPFSPDVREGRLYGRGTADMKSYLGVFAAIAQRFADSQLTEPVYFALTWDEETSCDGARELVKQLDRLGIHPRIAYVGEPTMMQVITSHKSMNSFDIHFRGIAAHSSLLPRGLNAIRYAAEFTQWFHTQIIDEHRLHGPYDDAFPVPYLTGGVNIVQAGIAGNTVPAHARLTVEFRALPHTDAPAIARSILAKVEQIDEAMREAIPHEPADETQADHVGADLTIRSLLYPLDAAADAPAVLLAQDLGYSVSPTKVTYGTEAGIYEAAGMSAVVIGPGDIAQAHGANEFVSLAQLEECERFFMRLLAHIQV